MTVMLAELYPVLGPEESSRDNGTEAFQTYINKIIGNFEELRNADWTSNDKSSSDYDTDSNDEEFETSESSNDSLNITKLINRKKEIKGSKESRDGESRDGESAIPIVNMSGKPENTKDPDTKNYNGSILYKLDRDNSDEESEESPPLCPLSGESRSNLLAPSHKSPSNADRESEESEENTEQSKEESLKGIFELTEDKEDSGDSEDDEEKYSMTLTGIVVPTEEGKEDLNEDVGNLSEEPQKLSKGIFELIKDPDDNINYEHHDETISGKYENILMMGEEILIE